ncbi:MAG TPA: hypothetical protein VLG49_04535 [Rhabdochlamydiaceae bacterium]|nr:hypothetical protein [Rhabdochlamydiaceae bacterium]
MLTKLFPSITVKDGEVWKEHVDLEALGLSVKDEPVFNKNKEIPFAKKLLAGAKVEGGAGITRLTIPKGHTFNKLEKFAESPKNGNPTRFSYIWRRVRAELGDKEVAETRIIYITNNVLEGTRNKTIEKQKELAKEQEFEIPEALTAATLAILEHVSSEKQPSFRLFGDNPSTCTSTSNEINGFHLVVGGLPSAGFLVDGSDGCVSDDIGAAGSAEVPRA